jgi:hypothetical protein
MGYLGSPLGAWFVATQTIAQNPKVSDISIQPAQHFGVVLSGFLPSKVAKRKEKSQGSTATG